MSNATQPVQPSSSVAPGPVGPTPGWPLGGLLSLSAAVFLALTTEMLPAGVLPPVARDLGVSEDTAGLLVTAFAYAMALGAIPLTALTRALPRRSLMVALMAGFAVVNVLTAVSGSFALTAAVRTAGGLLAGVFWSTAAAYAARLVAPERVGRAVAIVFAGQAVALTAGVPFGTAVGSAIGWRTAFGGLAVLALLLSVLVARFLPARPGDRARGGTRVGAVLRTPGVLVVSGTTLVVMLGQFAVYTYVATLLEGAGLGGAAIGWALLAYGAAGAVGVGAAATLVDRRPRAAVLGGLGLLEGAVLVLAVAGRSTVLVLVAVAAWGLAFGALPTLLHAAVVRAAPAAPEVADSVLNSGFNIGIGTGAILGGQVLARAGIGAVPWTALALLVAGAAVALAARRTGFPELRAGESG